MRIAIDVLSDADIGDVQNDHLEDIFECCDGL